jgi:hypothetical protein
MINLCGSGCVHTGAKIVATEHLLTCPSEFELKNKIAQIRFCW